MRWGDAMNSPEMERVQATGLIFELVQLLRLDLDSKWFPDSELKVSEEDFRSKLDQCLKEWADAQPMAASGSTGSSDTITELLSAIVRAAQSQYDLGIRIKEVIQACFVPPDRTDSPGAPRETTVDSQIEAMWPRLTRKARPHANDASTLLPIPHNYIVPGGRYIEFYYWDTYYTSLGLLSSGRHNLLADMVRNMAHFIDVHGHMPNGTRTYQASRSQVPHFHRMLKLLERSAGREAARKYTKVLQREHNFWNTGARKVELAHGTHLNRYWDALDTPRPEGYREDYTTALEAKLKGWRGDEKEVYRDLRAAAESGWDFSSRWLSMPETRDEPWPLASIRTTDVLPIDLNCLLYEQEAMLSEWLNGSEADAFKERATRRRERLLRTPFWDEECGWFRDVWNHDGELKPTDVMSLAGVYALFCRVAEPSQADRMAERIATDFLKLGGVVTSTAAFQSGQQWDYPNGWAPLQWAAVSGLWHYGHRDLAREIARRFVNCVGQHFERTGVLMEKYNVVNPARMGGGGEYPNQVGFGWTNGVTAAFELLLKTGLLLD
jgi:alpha,alpha-trehalase